MRRNKRKNSLGRRVRCEKCRRLFYPRAIHFHTKVCKGVGPLLDKAFEERMKEVERDREIKIELPPLSPELAKIADEVKTMSPEEVNRELLAIGARRPKRDTTDIIRTFRASLASELGVMTTDILIRVIWR